MITLRKTEIELVIYGRYIKNLNQKLEISDSFYSSKIKFKGTYREFLAKQKSEEHYWNV